MTYSPLFMLVEGPDDERFINHFSSTIKDLGYAPLICITYCKRKTAEINKHINRFQMIQKKHRTSKLIFLADSDRIYESIEQTKNRLKKKYPQLESDQIIIVVREIESWYVAGITGSMAESMGVSKCENTESIEKEFFEKRKICLIHGPNYAMIKCLETFEVDVAKRKNNSFKFFIENTLK